MSAVPDTEQGRWTLDAVLKPEATPSGEIAECSFGAGSVDGETVALGVVGVAAANGRGGSVSAFRRVADATTGDLKWVLQSRQTSSDVTSGSGFVAGFGRAVAVDGGATSPASPSAKRVNAPDAARRFHDRLGGGHAVQEKQPAPVATTTAVTAAAAAAAVAVAAVAALAAAPPSPPSPPPPAGRPRRRPRRRRPPRRRRRRRRLRRRPRRRPRRRCPAAAERRRGRGARPAGARAVREHVRGRRRVDAQQDARRARARAGPSGRRERFAQREDHGAQVQRDVFRGHFRYRRGGVVRRHLRTHAARRGGRKVRGGGETSAGGRRVRVPEPRRLPPAIRPGRGGGRYRRGARWSSVVEHGICSRWRLRAGRTRTRTRHRIRRLLPRRRRSTSPRRRRRDRPGPAAAVAAAAAAAAVAAAAAAAAAAGRAGSRAGRGGGGARAFRDARIVDLEPHARRGRHRDARALDPLIGELCDGARRRRRFQRGGRTSARKATRPRAGCGSRLSWSLCRTRTQSFCTATAQPRSTR